jgi:hypothetical protein
MTMKWFFVTYAIFSAGGDPGIVQGYVAPSVRVEIQMPSQDLCEQVAKLNRYRNAECWAKPDPKNDATEGTCSAKNGELVCNR